MAFVPDDLRDVSTPDTDKNFFKIVITDLELLTTYPLQFRWQYEDKTFSDWSAVKNVTTIGESVDIPSQPTFDIGFGYLIITWDGNNSTGSAMANVDRINVYLNNVFYGSIFAKGYTGKLSLALAAGTYSITFKAVSKLGKLSAASAAAVATITFGLQDAYNDLQNKLEASSSVIANAENQITSINGNGVTVFSSSGTATTGNRVTLNAEGLAGFKSDGKSSFAILTQTKYFDPVAEIMYPTNAAGREEIAAGTGFFNGAIYAQSGKFIGNVTISGQMKLGINAGGSGNHGIYITDNNYWYAGGAFKVGGSNQFMTWNGTNTLSVTGNISASTITGSAFYTTNWNSSTNGRGGIAIVDQAGGDTILFSQTTGGVSNNAHGAITSIPEGLTIAGPASTIALTTTGLISFQAPNGSQRAAISSSLFTVSVTSQFNGIANFNSDVNYSGTGQSVTASLFRNISAKTTTGAPSNSSGIDGDIVLVREA